MTKKEIRAVAGDRGGWNAIELPLLRALDEGHAVRVCFAATCAKQYTAGTLQPDQRFDIKIDAPDMAARDQFISAHGEYLLAVAASQSQEGAEVTRYALQQSHHMPRIGVEDMYLSMAPSLAFSERRLDRLCVINPRARQLILREFPELAGRVSVTGGPQFDKAVAMKEKWAARRQVFRHELKVTLEPVFLVVGGLNGMAEMLQLLEEGIAMAGIADQAKVILRTHPRAMPEDQEAARRFQETTARRWFTDISPVFAPSSDDLLPAVDFVLSGYSTTNYLGVLYQMPGVVYLGTPAIRRDLFREKGLKLPPEVEAGAAWYATTGSDIAKAIRAVYLNQPDDQTLAGIKQKQQETASASYSDGHATDRVWQEMEKLMTS